MSYQIKVLNKGHAIKNIYDDFTEYKKKHCIKQSTILSFLY